MDNDMRDDLLLKMWGEQKAASASLNEVKTDLKEHMKRTAQNEVLIQTVRDHVMMVEGNMSRDKSFVKGAVYIISALIALIAVVARFGIL